MTKQLNKSKYNEPTTTTEYCTNSAGYITDIVTDVDKKQVTYLP